MQLKATRAIAAVTVLGSFAQESYALPSTSIETANGIVNGFTDASAPSVAQFLGVPYAEAPVGERRWLPALAKQPFGTFDATTQGSTCPQTDPPGGGGAWAAEFLIRPNSTGEDCLNLNIWAPAKSVGSDELLPVVVWIHGGGFTEVRGSAPVFDAPG